MHYLANQENLQPKRQKYPFIKFRVPSTCSCGKSYIGETSENFEVRIDKYSDPNKQSEPARHAFEWRTLTIVQNWLNMHQTKLHLFLDVCWTFVPIKIDGLSFDRSQSF